MTATTTGLDGEAAARADERIGAMVDSAVADAVAQDDGDCMEGEKKCGYFEQTLVPVNCKAKYVCIEQHISSVGVGAATGDEQVYVLVLDPQSGRNVDLNSVIRSSRMKQFVDSLNEAVIETQQREGVYDAEYWTDLTAGDIGAWAPLASGVQVWFPKYTAGPGALGVVDIFVDYPKAQRAAPKPTQARHIAGGDEAINDLCTTEPTHMGVLRGRSSGSYWTSVMQIVLNHRGYSAGPVDGLYGPVTQSAVKAFQSDAGIVVDGLTGPQTWTALQDFECSPGSHGEAPAVTTPESNTNANTPVQLVTVPNVMGMGNKSAENTIRGSRLAVSIQRSSTDSSIAAESMGQCSVTDQQPRGGQAVEPNSTVTILIACPNTGYNAPTGPDPYTGANSGQYNGPAPPPAWTGH